MVGPVLEPRTELCSPVLLRREGVDWKYFWGSDVSGTVRRRVSGVRCDVI